MTVKELITELLEFDMNAEIELETQIGDDILRFPIRLEHFWSSCANIKSDDLDIEIARLYDETEEKFIGE